MLYSCMLNISSSLNQTTNIDFLPPGFLSFRKGRRELCCQVLIRRENKDKVQLERKKTEAVGAGALLQLVLSLLFDRNIAVDKILDSGSSLYHYPSDCLPLCSNERTDLSQVRRVLGELCFMHVIASRTCCCFQQFHLEPAYIAYSLHDKIGN
jgi:hypothetical protein